MYAAAGGGLSAVLADSPKSVFRKTARPAQPRTAFPNMQKGRL